MSYGARYRDPAGYRLFFAPLLVLLTVAGVLWAGGTAHAEEDDEDGEFVDGEVVVKLDPAALGPNPDCDATIEAINTQYGTITKDTLLGNANVACIYLLKVQDLSRDTETVAEEIQADPQDRVLYAEPNFKTGAPEGGGFMKARSDGEPEPSSDPASYEGQYAVEKMGLPGAHGTSKGDGVVVAVLDTGVQSDHPDLQGNLVTGYDFIDDDGDPADTPNGVDDDGDGETDEMTGHGTHVAGIVRLAAPEAEIMPLRVLDSDGRGNAFVIAEAVQYAIKGPDGDPATDDGADVINMSLGSSRQSNLLEDVFEDLVPEDDDGEDGDDGEGEGGGEADPEDALEGVPQEGVFVAASAGNENVESSLYPAADEGVTGVTSVNEDEVRSEFANYGAWVDVAAPGEEIYSAFPPSQYASWDGTSMAAPFVAGQAALIRALEPTLPSGGEDGQRSVESVIKDTARSLDATNPDYVGKLGAGHADACASMQALRPGTSCASSGGTLLDTLAPDTGILSGPSGTTRSTSVSFGFTASEADSRFQCSLNGAAFNRCSSPKSYSNLASKQHVFRVRAIDPAGNVDATPARRTWTVDAVRPRVVPRSPRPNSSIRDRTPTVKATVSDSQTNLAKGNIRLFLDGRRVTTFSYNRATDRLTYTSRKLSFGRHKAKIVARDDAGNVVSRAWGFRVVR